MDYNGRTGTLIRDYMHGPGIDELITWRDWAGNGLFHHYAADHLGSVIAIQARNGAIEETYNYSAWGEVNDATGNPFRYTGRRLDAETGLYYYRARYYAPAIGRFLQTDPIGYGDQMNLYAYVGNDPVNGRDPTGQYLESGIEIAGLIVGVASFANNVSEGNVGAAIVDAVGIVADGVALALPGVPGGAGLAIKAARGGDKIIDAVKGADRASDAAKGARGGERAGKSFTAKGKGEIDSRNAANNGGVNKCENCGVETVPGQRSEKGVTPPGNERQRDHVVPRSKGGDGSPENGQVLCRECNIRKSDNEP